MSNKTNEEKLRILQERLNQIKQKETTPKVDIPQVSQFSTNTTEIYQQEKNTISFSWLKYVIIIGCFSCLGIYAYKNITFDTIKSEEMINTSLVSETDKDKETIDYALELPGDNIAIVATFEEESLAKAMVNNLIVKGFNADYFYLPYKSNNTEEVYKVFIGPYENKEETNQWLKNIEAESSEIISL